jgi:hypothetical protein
MPILRTFMGIGTILYGSRDPSPDDSYVATQYFVIFFLPILPLAAFRVRRGARSLGGLPPVSWQLNTEYEILQKVPLSRAASIPPLVIFGFFLASWGIAALSEKVETKGREAKFTTRSGSIAGSKIATEYTDLKGCLRICAQRASKTTNTYPQAGPCVGFMFKEGEKINTCVLYDEVWDPKPADGKASSVYGIRE